MVLDLQGEIKVDFMSHPKISLGITKGIFISEFTDGDFGIILKIKILEGQELKIITSNLFHTLGLTHLKIVLDKDSKLVITEKNDIQLEESLEIEQSSNSKFVYQKLYKSSGGSFLNLAQKGGNSQTEIQNIILGQNITLEIEQKIIQNGKEQKLEHKTKFILSDNSDLRISHFGKSAVTSSSCEINQKIKGVILDSNSKVEMQPILEIDSDSSTSNHGASVGEFDHDEVQYLRTRGLNPYQIQKILVDSFLNDYYNQIEPICVVEGWRV
jgi:SUF system FeS cluster assembly, SufBD